MVTTLPIGSTNSLLMLELHLLKNISVFDKKPSDYMLHNIMEMFHLSPLTEAEFDKIISNFKDSAEG